MKQEEVKKHIFNIFGIRTNRKVIVLESDDWGTVRMASKRVYSKLLAKGYRVDECAYNRNDSLESNSDLDNLLNVITLFKDKNGNHPLLTLNNIVANPDFDKIKDSGFTEYFYEPFTETLKRYPSRDRVYDLYKSGIENDLIKPQLHGREHVNIQKWLRALQENQRPIHDAFEERMFTVHIKGKALGRKEFLDSFGGDTKEEIIRYKNILNSATDLFKSLWGFSSESFIAPCYIWPKEIHKLLKFNNIRFIQGTHVQRVPHQGSVKRHYHYMGQRNKYNQLFLVRNCFFEPSEDEDKDWVTSCLNDIDRAFFWKKPAIISSHRMNYIGSIRPKNSDRNLKLLALLLKKITVKYPDVEFMSTDKIGNLIEESK